MESNYPGGFEFPANSAYIVKGTTTSTWP